MKKKAFLKFLTLFFISTILSSCTVVGGIFKAGIGVGVFIVIAVIIIIMVLVISLSKKK